MPDMYRVKDNFPMLPGEPVSYGLISIQSWHVIDASQNDILMQMQYSNSHRSLKITYDRCYRFDFQDLIDVTSKVLGGLKIDLRHYGLIFSTVLRAHLYNYYDKGEGWTGDEILRTEGAMTKENSGRHDWFWLSDDEIKQCYLVYHHRLKPGSCENRPAVIQEALLREAKWSEYESC